MRGSEYERRCAVPEMHEVSVVKVVLFCGGLGTRLREHSDTVPKSLVPVGRRPIIWHIMRHYAHHGFKEFILCLGYRGDLIRKYFTEYDPYTDGDFVMMGDGTKLTPAEDDISDWKITFVETGLHANIAQRLFAVRKYLGGDEFFLANYSDQLSDIDIGEFVAQARERDVTASFLSVRPPQSYHNVISDEDGMVERLTEMCNADIWVNGGFFVLHRRIFEAIRPGDELVVECFSRLAAEGQLWTRRYEGFWKSMDTFKDKITFDRMDGNRDRPWRVWDRK